MKEERSDFLGIPSVRSGSLALPNIQQNPASGLERWLLKKLAQSMGNPAIAIRLWDGSDIRPAGGEPSTGLDIRDRRALWQLLANTEVGFGDGYSTGQIEVFGDLITFLEAIFVAYPPEERLGLKQQLQQRLNRVSKNSLAGSRRNIHHHYDLSNDFYALWLDPAMQYTCAYFSRPDASLMEAQTAKLDHVCRKLRLRPGETVFEAGCGWGGLARHMARHYGVKVRAYNISAEQVRYARERAKAEGLAERIEYVQDDYRTMQGQCDAFVSVGMLEHVGVEHYGELGSVIDRCLAPHGRGLIHSIGKNRAQPMSPWIEKRIFPGAYPPTLSEMMDILEPWSFSVLDVENLRLHYARTLEHWIARFDGQADEVESMFDAAFVRAWRLYLASSVASFRTGALQLFQVLFARPRHNAIPWTREHLYRSAEHYDGEM